MNYIEDFNMELGDILVAHEYNYPPNFSYTNYAAGRGFFGLIIALTGRVTYTISGSDIVFGAGQIAFIPARTAYTVTNNMSADFNHFTVNFNINRYDENSSVISSILNSKDLCIFGTDNLAMYTNLFEKITSFWSDKKPGYRMASKSVLYELLFNFFTEYMTRSADMRAYDKILPAKRYIDSYYRRDITIAELADMCGMSQTNFRRSFKAVCNVSPIEYLAQLRLLKARDLLLCKFYSVDEVAHMTGFSDANYFSRFFKRRFGQPPSQYRKIF